MPDSIKGVKLLEEYSKHAKDVTESLVKAHEIRIDYIQHIFGSVQSFHKTNGEVFKAGLQHREQRNAIYDALGISQVEFTGQQEARGLDTFAETLCIAGISGWLAQWRSPASPLPG